MIDVTLIIDLRPYGYAPGGYIHPCVGCGLRPMSRPTGDKRSWRCFPCAAEAALEDPARQGGLFNGA